MFEEAHLWTFHRQLAFSIAKARFYLPSPSIGKKNIPCIFFCPYTVIGNQIPDLPLYSRFDQIQLRARAGVPNWCPPKTTLHFESCLLIPYHLLREILFPVTNLPKLLFSALCIDEYSPVLPSDHKSNT